MDNGSTSPVTRLLAEALTGRASRREVLKRASALGLSAPLVGIMLSAQAHSALGPDVESGSLIELSEELPDFSGNSINGVPGQDDLDIS